MSSQLIGISQIPALTAWVRSVTKGTYSVRFSETAKTAYITGKQMVIPRLNAAMTLRDTIRLRGFCLHETSHPIYQQDAFRILKENPMEPNCPLRAIYNMNLDVHAETSRAKEWPGDAKALSEFGAVTGHDVTDNIKRDLAASGGKIPDDFAKIGQMMVASINSEGQWNIGLRVGFDELINRVFPDEIREGAEVLRAKFDLDKRLTDTSETPESLWQLAKDIFEFLFEKPAEQELSEQKEKMKGSGNGEPSKGEPEDSDSDGEDGDSEGDEDEEGEGSASPKKYGGDGEGKEAKPSKGKLTVDKLVWTQHYELKKGGASGMGFDYSKHTEYQVYTPIDFDRFMVIDYDKGAR